MPMQNKDLPVPADTKFSQADLVVKKTVRAYRLHHDLTIPQLAERLDLSVKQLEDMEAVRNYGVRIPWEAMLKFQEALDIPLPEFVTGPTV